jgi:hypothetical protein
MTIGKRHVITNWLSVGLTWLARASTIPSLTVAAWQVFGKPEMITLYVPKPSSLLAYLKLENNYCSFPLPNFLPAAYS